MAWEPKAKIGNLFSIFQILRRPLSQLFSTYVFLTKSCLKFRFMTCWHLTNFNSFTNNLIQLTSIGKDIFIEYINILYKRPQWCTNWVQNCTKEKYHKMPKRKTYEVFICKIRMYEYMHKTLKVVALGILHLLLTVVQFRCTFSILQ